MEKLQKLNFCPLLSRPFFGRFRICDFKIQVAPSLSSKYFIISFKGFFVKRQNVKIKAPVSAVDIISGSAIVAITAPSCDKHVDPLFLPLAELELPEMIPQLCSEELASLPPEPVNALTSLSRLEEGEPGCSQGREKIYVFHYLGVLSLPIYAILGLQQCIKLLYF